ncbi:MAG TPA: peptidoglycan editing factor PgeF [Bryobacteraceae bacterium]|nr:peptidoglycan editing factor PgeF [Bryobacteraceae bacterium]
MFYKDSREIYRVPELDQFAWLEHGFGTRLADVPACVGNLTTVKQIHSATCVVAEGPARRVGEADALLERRPGTAVAVKTADCIPILLVDPRNRTVAAVHAGWRGTVAQIARHAVEAMRQHFGTRPEDLHAAIGPGIGKCCYEVGPEVAQHFGESGRAHIDLTAANRRQLLETGLASGRIYSADLCTMCLAGEFHSYRRDREAAGRMFSFAGICQAVE